MSKFPHSSLGRDLSDQRRREPPRMGLFSSNPPLSSGFGRLGQSSGRLTSLMDLGPASKMGPQGSRGMMPSGSSSQNLPSIFSLGSRAPPPMPPPPSRDPDQAGKILSSFGLSSGDLDELSRYPEEKITADNLPQIIEHLKRRREDLALANYRDRLSRETLRPSRDDWDDLRPLRRESLDDRPSGLNPVVDYDHGTRSQKLGFRERLDIDDRLRDRERHRDDSFLSEPPFRKLESDFDRMNYMPQQERSVFDKARGMPSARNMDDFHGLPPKEFPHLCSLCEMPSNNPKSWNEHITGRLHKKQRLVLLDLYPDWTGHGIRADPYMLQQSTNPAPGLLGPPPPGMGMSMGGGPEDRHGNFRGHLGNEDMPGPRPMQRNMGFEGSGWEQGNPNLLPPPGSGRVVHIMEFERGKNLRFQLMKLAKPFGTITQCLILNKMNEAFIEMSTPAEAYAIVDYYNNNTPLVYGKPVRIHISQKYKRIKKPEGEQKAGGKTSVSPDAGRVIHLSGLPQSTYTDSAVVKLVENFGKVKTYILMRMRHQAFIELENAEDAQNMVDACTTTPLFFQGRQLKVLLSQRYKKLVLRIPNTAMEKQKQKEKEKGGRKRTSSPDRKNETKAKQSKTEESSDADKSSQVVTTEDNDPTAEETDLVSDSCEPELVDETGDEEAAALLESGSSVGDEAEVPDISDLDQKEMSEGQGEPLTSTPAAGKGFKENVDEFVTLDEVGGEEAKFDGSGNDSTTERSNGGETVRRGRRTRSSAAAAAAAVAAAEESAGETSDLPEPITEFELGPYQPNNPVGVDQVIPKTGFYCKLCSLFYTSEEVAKVTHCSSLAHYQKLKKLLNKTKNEEN